MANPIDLLLFRASLQPEAVALQEPDRQLTCFQLLRVVKKAACGLRRQGVRPGQVVVVAMSDRFVEWILTLALIHEATVTCTNQGYAPVEAFGFDWMLTDREGQHCPADKTIMIDNAWLREVQRNSADIACRQYASEDAAFRLILTSGTTGISKGVLYSVRQTLHNTRQHAWYGDHPRALVMFGMSSGVGFRHGLHTLIIGSPFYTASDRAGNVEVLRKFALGTLVGAPVQVAGVIAELASQGIELPALESVRFGGGPASAQFIATVKSGLCSNFTNHYGSTEVGSTCLYRPDPGDTEIPVGFPLPGVEIQIVGSEREPLAADTEGSVRIRAPGMASGYYNNPEATRERFVDGWFYPGDRGRLRADGCLVLHGRDSEVLNLGGVKFNPDSIDEFVKRYPGVRDAAAFSVEGRLGVEHLAVALEVDAGFDLKSLSEGLFNRFGNSCRAPLYIRVQQVPRNLMGKVQRRELRSRLQKRLAARAQEQSAATG